VGFGVGHGVVGGVDHAATINIKCQLDIKSLICQTMPIGAFGNYCGS
jgi:hypothetical protein